MPKDCDILHSLFSRSFPPQTTFKRCIAPLSGDYTDEADKKNGGKAIILNSRESRGSAAVVCLRRSSDKNLRARKCTTTDEQREKVRFNEGV